LVVPEKNNGDVGAKKPIVLSTWLPLLAAE
jgi:hypothetical protein